jgi:response regulator of citrate/malate metabolism
LLEEKQTVSQDNLEQFREAVLEDAALQETLRDVRDRKTFVALVMSLGVERGYDFTAEEVEEALRASRRAWLERWI